MKSIGIITIQNSQNNYGGALQCFALYQFLHQQGYSVEVIDLHRPNNADYIDSIRFRRMRSHIGIMGLVKGWIKELFGIKKLHNPNFSPNWNLKAGERFMEFNSKIKMSSPYSYIPDLYKNPPQYDIYITGSDQLWNPDQPYCLEPYFLTFVKNKKALKISYGTSIGILDLHECEKKLFRKWLFSYDSISVREKQACTLLETITQRNIYQVPDPTFLLDPEEWLKMSIAPKGNQNYILIFYLGQNKDIIQTGIRIAKEMGLKLKIIEQNYQYPIDSTIEVIADAGPLEFIGLIKHAKLILTNSFHCTVFSLITGVQNFYTYIAPDNNRGSRIVDLLETYHLSDHIISSMNDIPPVSQLSNIKINSSLTYDTMKREQKKGQEYLISSISRNK